MIDLTEQISPVTQIDLFVETIVKCFLDEGQWGYALGGGTEGLDLMLRRVIAAEYNYGV